MPNPPLNVSLKIVHLSGRGLPVTNSRETVQKPAVRGPLPRRTRDIPLLEQQEDTDPQEEEQEPDHEEGASVVTHQPHSVNSSLTQVVSTAEYTATDENVNTNTSDTLEDENATDASWPEPTGTPSPTDDEFVNAVVPEYEDSNEPGSAMDLTLEPTVMPTKLPPILLELRWLPPHPPTAFDGFNIYIYRDGKFARLF